MSNDNTTEETKEEVSTIEALDEGISLDELMPEGLKEAKTEEVETGYQSDTESENSPIGNEAVESLQTLAATQEPESTPEEPVQATPVEEEELDLSEENINKLIEGDIDTLKTVKPEDDTPEALNFDEDEYVKKFKETYGYVEFDKDGNELTDMLRSVAESAALKNKTYQNSINKELEETKSKLAKLEEKDVRFKSIERGLYFDQLPETISKYGEPMNHAVSEINRIITTEGLPVSIGQVIGAKDRKQVNEYLKDVDLPDGVHTQLMNHWRNYKDTDHIYRTAKNAAVTKLKSSTSTSISDEVLVNVVETAVNNRIKTDPRFKYVDDAISEGLTVDHPVMDVISKTKGNLSQIFDAIRNPTDYAKDLEFQENLADFFLQAAHREAIEDKYYELQNQYKSKESDLKRLAKAHLELKRSMSRESEGAPVSIRAKGVSRKQEDTEAEKMESFKDLLKGEINLEDLI